MVDAQLQKIEAITCPRCDLVMDGFNIRFELAEGHMVCPRCARIVDDLYDQTVVEGRALTDPQKRTTGERELRDLMKILRNWERGYIGKISEDGIDWSMPHEFFQEIWDFMLPYVKRLKDTGYTSPGLMREVGDQIIESIRNIIMALAGEEDLMRLTGRWTDDEQEIKEYWQGRAKQLGGTLFLCLPESTDGNEYTT